MERSCDSSPQSLTTTQEQLTTLRGLPSRSIWPIDNISLLPHHTIQSSLQRTETGPLAELLAIRDLDERDLVLRAERDNELLVGLLLASLVEDAHVSLAAVEGLGGLAQTAGKTVVDERELQHALESLKDGHLALAGGGIGADFDLGGRGNLGLGIVFSVRLWCMLAMRFLECLQVRAMHCGAQSHGANCCASQLHAALRRCGEPYHDCY